MKRMPKEVIESEIAWSKDEYYDTTKKYFQPIKDIIVVTEGYEGNEIQWKLNGEISKNRRKLQTPVIHSPKLRFTKYTVQYDSYRYGKQSLFHRSHRMKTDQLIAMVCSYLQDEGMGAVDGLNLFFQEWSKVKEMKEKWPQ